jgi:DNA-3-methyladenine glycosylase I
VPLQEGPDGKPRCGWGVSAPDYVDYHDREWGFPVADDRRLFEKLCLEGFQSGLSWLTILRKRESFRKAFAGFDFVEVARFGEKHVAKLLGDAGIVRHRGKILATIQNARATRALVDEHGSLAAFVWRYEPDARTRTPLVSESPESKALSKELKKRGFAFVGPTTVYAFMQAMGLVDDHLEGCCVRPAAERARKRFERPVSTADSPMRGA